MDKIKPFHTKIQQIQFLLSNDQLLHHSTETNAEMAECWDDVPETLPNYPLLVWHDFTSSNNSENSLLEHHSFKTLASLVASKCEDREVVEWTALLEWFICAVIGLESKASLCGELFHFDWDDVMVDELGTVRIHLSASHSGSSPPHSPQTFSDGVVRLSQLFLDLIRQLSLSNCLSKIIDKHFIVNMVPSLLHHFINHLIVTGTLLPTCHQCEIDKIVKMCIPDDNDPMLIDFDLQKFMLGMIANVYTVVHILENKGLVNTTVRLTEIKVHDNSPQYHKFVTLLHPEFTEIKAQFDQDLFEEAKRISLWKELLQKFASGEEVQKDKSFITSSIFRPTLLSLQAKFQRLASSVDGSDETIQSQHSSNPSLRTLSSSTQLKQESLQLVALLHSLITSPPHPSLHKQAKYDAFDSKVSLYHLGDLDPTEKFHSSIFDEDDNENLVSWLVRCRDTCDLVGAEACIRDTSTFLDRTISALGSSNSLVRTAALSLYSKLKNWSGLTSQLPRLWSRLSSAFRDGHVEEQDALIQMSTTWITQTIKGATPTPFPVSRFDWDGLFSADLNASDSFHVSIILIMSLRHRSIEDQIDLVEANRILLSFEHHQHAVARINSDFDAVARTESSKELCEFLISFSLAITLQIKGDFPSPGTAFLTTHPEIDISQFILLRIDKRLFLCLHSLNQNQPHQPPLDLIFERILRMNPLSFLDLSSSNDFKDPPTLHNTALCGFHALCRRGVHIDLFEYEVIKAGHHLYNCLWMFVTPLISITFHLFLYFPPPLVVRLFLPNLWCERIASVAFDPLRMVMSTLLAVTAPFGDCLSLKELYRSVRSRCQIDNVNSTESGIALRCRSLELLNIPSGFGSALAHLNPRITVHPSDNQVQPHLSSDESHLSSRILTAVYGYLSDQARSMSDGISLMGALLRDLNGAKAHTIVFDQVTPQVMCKGLLAPIPAAVSVFL
ncbi:hypothetical protein BLNAU_9668 [Blattamonas nauphoetae]|uniref:Uncharacterized protein n=1 Tax=Blattamonas nauphoetae TaxID=2049346 RepID=A0ABQ9XVC9_9EUKA|nr:hypothetical protein BLNAU_9668 [Blattamonas nauphoetae]